MKEILEYKLFEVGSFSISVWSLISLVLIFMGTRLLIAFFSRLFRQMAARRNMDKGRQYSFLLLMRYFVWIFSISLMLGALGIQLTFLLASSAALLVGLGLGLQQIFSDFVAGIFILFDGTIERGDVLQVGDMVCLIEEINLRTSIVRDRNDMIVIIPNHKFIHENVINWSHNNKVTRFIITVGVAYESDMEKVRSVLLDCAAAHNDVIQAHEQYRSTVRMADFGSSSVLFELLFYSENMFRIENTKSDLRFLIWEAFKREQIRIPFPQMDVHHNQIR